MLFLEPQPFLRTAAANAVASPKETLEKKTRGKRVQKNKQRSLPTPVPEPKKIAQSLAEGNPFP